MTVAGIEPAGLAVKRTLGKNFKGDPNNLLTCPYCLRGRSLCIFRSPHDCSLPNHWIILF
nr:MAG TPA: Protein of unknown function (DUF1360) [Caudoviricetes sp.]